MSLGPSLAAMQVLVAGAGEDRPRWVERPHQRGGFLVDVAIELLGMTLAQPGERPAPRRIRVHCVANDRRLVEQHVDQLFGLRHDGFAKKRQRPHVSSMHVGRDHRHVLPDQKPRLIRGIV